MSNTGIYHDGDSDHDSLYADSPADGYFEQREHPRETFVQDSSVTAEAQAKAQEAAQSQSESAVARPPSEHSQTSRDSIRSRQSPTWADEAATQMLDAGPAPPDYFAATADRHHQRRHSSMIGRTDNIDNTQSNQGTRSYGSLDPSASNRDQSVPQSDSGSGSYGRLFPLQAEPQSLSSPGASVRFDQGEEVDEESGLLGQKSPPRRRSWRRVGGCCKPWSMINWALVIGAVILVFLLARASREVGKSGSGNDDSSSPSQPDRDGGSNPSPYPSRPERPDVKVPLPPTSSQCHFNSYSETYSFHHAYKHRSNFTFLEMIEAPQWLSGGITGEIRIAPGIEEQNNDIEIWMTFATTDHGRVSKFNCEVKEDSFELKLPSFEKETFQFGHRPCLAAQVRIEVKRGVKLEHWRIDTANFNVIAENGLFDEEAQGIDTDPSSTWIANSTTINAVKGNVNVAYWSSRDTTVDLVSGSITGKWALRDLLYLKTTSGAISVEVDPKEVDPNRPLPADFQALTNSGLVSVQMPTAGTLPERDYKTRVQTRSSTISGCYVLGIMSSFHTTSGAISADILPYDADMYTSFLRSETSSGMTNLNILSPYRTSGKKNVISRLHSLHKSASGTVNLHYPSEWEGTIDAETNSGSIIVHGKDVKTIVKSQIPGVLKQVVAEKGHGNSRLDVRTTSGSVNIQAGDDY